MMRSGRTCAFWFGLILACAATLSVLAPNPAAAQAPKAPAKVNDAKEVQKCSRALEQRIKELQQLIRKTEDLTPAELRGAIFDFVEWRKRFKTTFHEAYLVRFGRACVNFIPSFKGWEDVSTGDYVIWALMLLAADAQPARQIVKTGMDPLEAIVAYGWKHRWKGSAVTRAIPGSQFSVLRGIWSNMVQGLPFWVMAGVIDQGLANIRNIGEWKNIAANTAFHGWLLDCAEYGKKGPVTQDLRDFLRDQAKILARITGDSVFKAFANGGAQDGQISQVLERHCLSLLTFFGQFEEAHGDNAFPRYKVKAQGRYGGGRYDADYYRKIVIARYRVELTKLLLELGKLNAKACRVECPDPDTQLDTPEDGEFRILPPEGEWVPPQPKQSAEESPDEPENPSGSAHIPAAPSTQPPDANALLPQPPASPALPEINIPKDSPVGRLLANPCGIDAARACAVLLPQFRDACTREVSALLEICRNKASYDSCSKRCEGNWQQGIHDQGLREIAKAHIRAVAKQSGDAFAQQAEKHQAEIELNNTRVDAIRARAAGRKPRFSERGEMRAREVRNRYLRQKIDQLIDDAAAVESWRASALKKWTADATIPDGRCTAGQNDENRKRCLADCAQQAPAGAVNVCQSTYIPQLVLPYGLATLYPLGHPKRPTTTVSRR